MGIFGDLDAKEIPDNPYFVKQGEYTAIISGAAFQKSENKGRDQHQLVISYKIADEDSKFYGQEVRDWFNIFPEMTEDLLDTLPPKERRTVMAANSAVKRRLCGQPDLDRKGLGVDIDELEDDDNPWDPTSLVGLEVDLAIVNRGENNEYTNISWANLRE